MAKTVATIDGDSSGLVSELGQAKKAMGDLGGQGKKLTDQLREVADQADVAAGNLVNKIGGPTAIKAIAGVGGAFAVAKTGVEAFLDSSEALFRSYGDEGQKVWDTVEKSLFSIKGSFAQAVLGSDDMYEAGARLQGMFEVVKDAVDGLLGLMKPLFVAFTGLLQLTTDYGDKVAVAAVKLREQAAAQTAVKTTGDQVTTTLENLNKQYFQLTGQTEKLQELDLARAQLDAQKAGQQILATERAQDEVEAKAAVAEQMNDILKLTTDQVGLMAQYGQVGNSQEARDEAFAKRLELNTAQVMADEMKRREAIRDSAKAQLEQANQLYLFFEEKRLKVGMEGPKPEEDKTGKGSKTGETAEQRAAREAAELQALYESNNKLEDALVMDRLKQLDDRLNAETERKKAAIDAVNAYALQMEAEHDAEIHARGELTVAEQEKLNQERLQAFKDRAGQELGIYMQNSGKMLAIGELSAKEAADMARQQLGNIIMGYGDKAMAEAGIMAASLNPLAVPMAAAGVAAYAIGSTLSADKKSSGTTPSTEKPADASTGTTNYAFNLRVDSAFADGESIARKFAQMQEAARQRGLLTAGAY
jgi:hypothetical protein